MNDHLVELPLDELACVKVVQNEPRAIDSEHGTARDGGDALKDTVHSD